MELDIAVQLSTEALEKHLDEEIEKNTNINRLLLRRYNEARVAYELNLDRPDAMYFGRYLLFDTVEEWRSFLQNTQEDVPGIMSALRESIQVARSLERTPMVEVELARLDRCIDLLRALASTDSPGQGA